ncbi:MAG: DegT/DnrJ/EryC1/StrS family aminotransferase [Bacteroidota bacterium]|nr:DegT/DnrJ/EryC1/StrS family aminotransferase [Candidatus Kapabacteria bacterium]MDW8220140.1 DegT/DnrJ/EryC1/StrS family aminotransferase [Bacteroidota bacterium]
MRVPLIDLQAHYQSLKPALDEALLRVAASQVCILGKEVEDFEHAIAAYTGTQFAVAVSSGTDALLMALMALDVRAGDEVIVPTFSFFATAGAVARLGATPTFIDVEPQSFTLNPLLLEERITSRTKAIIPVHLFGQCAAMNDILCIAERHGIPVIEDAAQAIGAEYVNGKKAGSMGIMGCFSFYPTKNLGAFGDAGAITTNDEALYIKLKQMRNHGMEPRYHHKFVGGNFRMDALQAAVLNVKLPHVESWHAARRRNADLYTRLFVDYGLASIIPARMACRDFPHCPECATQPIDRFSNDTVLLVPEQVYRSTQIRNYHIFHQYTIRAPHRDKLRNYLAEHGIASEIYYPLPLHRQECFQHIPSAYDPFPIATCLSAHVLSLPMYPELCEEQIQYIVQTIAQFFDI